MILEASLEQLPDLDSNQDKQNQNLRYYRYTIGQVFVGLLGFEPRQTESKSVVLPLHHNPIVPNFIWDCKSRGYHQKMQNNLLLY